MKTFRKIIAVILTVLAVMSLGVISSSAASVVPPKFELKVTSQTAGKATLLLSLTSGEFNAIDIELKTSVNVSSIISIVTTTEFDGFVKAGKMDGNQVAESTSPVTGKISLASTGKINKPMPIYTITVNKKTAADLVPGDITAKVIECVVSNGTTEERVASKVTFEYFFGKIDIAEENINLNYKASASLTVDTTYAKEDITWTSSNANVATVDENGNIYASGKGTATITAENPDGSIKDSCNVNVTYAWWQWIIVIVLFGWIWY